MKRMILAAVLLTAFHVWAQKPKSNGEREALVAVQTAQQKNDFIQITNYAERILDGDPKNALAQVTIALETARRIRENDLDKEEQLAKAEKYADQALANAPTLAKPQSTITDADWDVRKKEIMSQAHEAKGMV